MNQELEKKLKDAGFPFEHECHDCGEGYGVDVTPSLSQLIEACGDDFGGLSRAKHPIEVGQWAAYSITANNFSDMFGARTPEESVANLWLSLHEKP